MSKPEHSWHEFYDIHPAAAFYHGFSTEQQLKELRDDIAKREVIFDPIHTASVPGAFKPFVIDGISRLDQLEALGYEIIDSQGNWKGMLASISHGGLNRYVVHHPGKTDQEVWDMVHSLNDIRRHLDESQRSMVAAKRVDLREQAAEENSKLLIGNKLPRPAHRPSKGVTKAEEEEAETMNVSVRSVRRARKVLKQAPERVSAIMTGKETVGKVTNELPPKKRKQSRKNVSQFRSIRNEAWLWFQRLLNNKYPESEQPEAVLGIVETYLTRKDSNRKRIEPELVYPDGTKRTLKAAIDASIGSRNGGAP
jgi:hypothetical protein